MNYPKLTDEEVDLVSEAIKNEVKRLRDTASKMVTPKHKAGLLQKSNKLANVLNYL